MSTHGAKVARKYPSPSVDVPLARSHATYLEELHHPTSGCMATPEGGPMSWISAKGRRVTEETLLLAEEAHPPSKLRTPEAWTITNVEWRLGSMLHAHKAFADEREVLPLCGCTPPAKDRPVVVEHPRRHDLEGDLLFLRVLPDRRTHRVCRRCFAKVFGPPRGAPRTK
jgi:hypothetical protein